MDREAFLDRVRRAQRAAEIPEASPARLPETHPTADLVDLFIERLEAVDGTAHRATTDEEAFTVVIDLLYRYRTASVLAWHAGELPVPDLLGRLIASGVRLLDPLVPADPDGRRSHHEGYETLEVGLTGADGALAESGTLVLSAGNGRPRMASLIPATHIALLRARDIVPTLQDWVAAQPTAAASTSNLVFITGPSRTADIEQELNLGVHGPRHLHVVVLES